MDYNAFKDQFNITLNEQQEAAVIADNGAVLLLAVPGSGKTTVLVTRLGYMIYCCGIAPENILTMTYTVAATVDMKKRFSSFFGDEFASRLEFRTINGVSAKIISYYERTLGRKAFDLVSDEWELSLLLRGIYQKVTGSFAADGDVKNIRSLITYAKNMMLSDTEIEKLDIDNPHFSKIYHEYCSAMLKKKLMDYDDQMIYAYKILKSYPKILSHFRSIYRFICVDEAQDTSKIQHMIIRLLVGEDNDIFMVGDEDQSIYGFRAAYPEALMDFEKTYPGAEILILETNYRSTVQIVENADSFIRRNKHRHLKNMKASHGKGKPVGIVDADSRIEQYEQITELAESTDSELAILYRDNDSAIPIIDIFDRKGVKYRSRGVDNFFFTHPVVKDILDIIRFAFDTEDADCFMSIYYKFNQGISKDKALQAVEISKQDGITPLRALLKHCDLPKWLEFNVQELIYNFDLIKREKAFDALRRITYYMGYRDYLDSRGADKSKLDILFAVAKPLRSIADLPERLIEIEKIIRNGSASNSKIVLSTIHSSKGLEYDKVLLIDVIDGLFPKSDMSEYSPDDEMSLEEERRLFYVGITRAKKELTVMKYKALGQSSSFTEHFLPKTIKTAVPKIKNKVNANGFIVGTKVMHKKFGEGVITGRKKMIAEIRFQKGGTRYVDIEVALKNNIMSFKE